MRTLSDCRRSPARRFGARTVRQIREFGNLCAGGRIVWWNRQPSVRLTTPQLRDRMRERVSAENALISRDGEWLIYRTNPDVPELRDYAVARIRWENV